MIKSRKIYPSRSGIGYLGGIRFLLFTIAVFVVPSNGFSQTYNQKLYSAQVLDSETKEPLIGVHIRVPDTGQGTVSDQNGYFEIELEILPTILVLTYLGYEPTSKTIQKNEKKIFAIYMKRAATDLPILTVTGKPEISEITPSDITIKDFIIFENQILMLTYESLKSKDKLVLADFEGNYLFEKSVEDFKKIQGFEQTCLGGIHFLTGFEAMQVFTDSEGIFFGDTIPRWKYEMLTKDCVSSSEDYLYYERHISNGQSVKYEAIPKDGGAATAFGLAMDEEAMEQYMDDLYEVNLSMRQTNVMTFQDPDKLRKFRAMEAKLDAYENLFYQKLNIQLFNLGEELCIFNHQDLQLEFFDLDGNFKKVVPLSYSISKNWDGKVYFDQKQQQFYTQFDSPDGKILSLINLESGELESSSLVECVFLEESAVHDGFFYWLESGLTAEERNRVLYRVRL